MCRWWCLRGERAPHPLAAVFTCRFQVRQEKLLRDVGYHVRSGSCRVRDLRVILLDRSLPLAALIDILVDELAAEPLETLYLSPAARRLLERAGAPTRADTPPAT